MTKLKEELIASIRCETEIKTSIAVVDLHTMCPSCLHSGKNYVNSIDLVLKTHQNLCTMLQKHSKWEVKAWLCWNLTILLPLRFYMKSNFGEFKLSRNVTFGNFRLWRFCILIFSQFEQLSTSKFTKIQSSEYLKLPKMTFLDCLNVPKFDFT